MTYEVFTVTTGYSCTGCGCSLHKFQMCLLDPSKETLKKIARGILRMLSTAAFYLYAHSICSYHSMLSWGGYI